MKKIKDVSNPFIDENCSEVYVLTTSRPEQISRRWFLQKLCHLPFFHIVKTKSSSVSGLPLLLFLIATEFSGFHSCSSKQLVLYFKYVSGEIAQVQGECSLLFELLNGDCLLFCSGTAEFSSARDFSLQQNNTNEQS